MCSLDQILIFRHILKAYKSTKQRLILIIKAYDTEDIYSLTIRARGDLNALSQFIESVDSLDDALTIDDQFEFDDTVQLPVFTASTERDRPKQKISFTGLSLQTIYDVAIFTRGTLESLADVITTLTSLDQTVRGIAFELDESNDIRREIIKERKLTFATGDEDFVLTNFLQLESGFYLLLETDNKIILENG